MRSPPKLYVESDNPQQVSSISYPPALNNSFFFPTPPLSPVIFLYVLLTSFSISLILLLFVRVLYFVHLLGIINFPHFLSEFVIHHFEQPNFIFQNVS